MERLMFTTYPDTEEKEFFIIADTRVNQVNYLLVATEDSDEADSLILKDMSDESDTEAHYEIVEEDDEFNAVAAVFRELLEDYEIK